MYEEDKIKKQNSSCITVTPQYSSRTSNVTPKSPVNTGVNTPSVYSSGKQILPILSYYYVASLVSHCWTKASPWVFHIPLNHIKTHETKVLARLFKMTKLIAAQQSMQKARAQPVRRRLGRSPSPPAVRVVAERSRATNTPPAHSTPGNNPELHPPAPGKRNTLKEAVSGLRKLITINSIYLILSVVLFAPFLHEHIH